MLSYQFHHVPTSDSIEMTVTGYALDFFQLIVLFLLFLLLVVNVVVVIVVVVVVLVVVPVLRSNITGLLPTQSVHNFILMLYNKSNPP